MEKPFTPFYHIYIGLWTILIVKVKAHKYILWNIHL